MKGFLKNKRSILLLKNVLASFFLKGWSALVSLIMIPLTLQCLGAYKNGVWLTVSSLLIWIDQMDIGLGNGLRNKLAAYMAHNEQEKARQAVSSTMAMLICIVIPLAAVLLALVWNGDVYSFLNVSVDTIPELRTALSAAVIIVCFTFVFKFVGNVYMGMQLPAVSNLLITVGQTLALAATFILFVVGKATFLNIVVVNTLATLIVYLSAYPVTFWMKFPFLRPRLSSVNLSSAYNMGTVGIKFFWIQISSLLQFMSVNILISRFFSPELVTPYQVAYRYTSLMLVVFSVICMPFWNATTDAYERGDIDWIKKASRRMDQIVLIASGCLVVMVAVSPWVYDIWVGNKCEVPLSMTAIMALYVFLLVASTRYSFFLNGIGALRLQLYMTVSAIVFIPLAWLISELTHNILWLFAVMCFCNIPGLVVNVIQFNKIINGKAKGFWRI